MPIEGVAASPADVTTTDDYIIVDEEGVFIEVDDRAFLSYEPKV